MRWQVQGRDAYAYTGGKPCVGEQPSVVFIHGAQHDHSVWILQSRYLAHHGHSVLALDLPGHGRSAGAPLTSVPAMADWVAEVIRTAGLKRVMLVGHSMGSLVALHCATLAPERVAGIALIGTAAPMKVSEALLKAARDDEARAFDMINFWSHASLSARPGCPGPGFSVFVQNRRLMERQTPGVLLSDFLACNAYEQAFECADTLACPSLFILGAQDLMTPPKAARALIDRVRQSASVLGLAAPEVVDVTACGHALMSEQPDAVLGALRSFSARLNFALASA